jgi:hypothetical protein
MGFYFGCLLLLAPAIWSIDSKLKRIADALEYRNKLIDAQSQGLAAAIAMTGDRASNETEAPVQE